MRRSAQQMGRPVPGMPGLELHRRAVAAEARPGGRFSGYSGQLSNEVKDLASIGQSSVERLPVGVGEIDRVLGGGIVPGSVILLGGDPGIGKSTLLLQLVAALAGRSPSLYITGRGVAGAIGHARAAARIVAGGHPLPDRDVDRPDPRSR